MAKVLRFNRELDPDILVNYPDFGFSDELNSEYLDKNYDLWRLLYD